MVNVAIRHQIEAHEAAHPDAWEAIRHAHPPSSAPSQDLVKSDMTQGKLEGIESLRGIAAVYVFYQHCVLMGIFPGYQYLHVVTKFGQAAVLIFFFLSGFVIYFSTAGRNLTFSQYFLLRFRRIYPLFLVALAIAYLCKVITNGRFFLPNLHDLVINLLLLQDRANPGSWGEPFEGNAPLWSLGYEWFFYMAYMPTMWLTATRPQLGKYLVCGLSVFGFFCQIVFPNQISMFLAYYVVWWAGVEIAREYRATGSVTLRGQVFSLVSIAILCALFSGYALFLLPVNSGIWGFPILQARHFAEALLILITGLTWYKARAKGFWTLMGWGRYFAPFSYALYVIHMPIVLLAQSSRVLRPLTLNIVWVIPTTLGVAWLLERRLQPWINRHVPVDVGRRQR